MTTLKFGTTVTLINARQAMVGLALGVYLTATALIAGAMAMTATPVRAAEDELCMAQSECIDATEAKGGNCDGKHCFESGHGCSLGQGYCYTKWASTKLSVHIGGFSAVADLGDYIVKVYDYAFGIAAVLAAIMMVVGGFMYLSSFGSAEMVKKGKGRMLNAAIGLVIVACAYTILQTVNPDLVRFKLPKFATVKRSFMTTCNRFQVCYPCGTQFYIKIPKGKSAAELAAFGGAGSMSDGDCQQYTATDLSSIDTAKFEASSACFGNSCRKVSSACGDDANRCRQAAAGDRPEDNCKPLGKDLSYASSGTGKTDCEATYQQCLNAAKDVGFGEATAGTSNETDSAATVKCKQKLAACQQAQQTAAEPAAATSTTAVTGASAVDSTGVTNGWFCQACTINGNPCKSNAGCCSNHCVNSSGSQLGAVVTSTGVSSGGILSGTMVCSSGELGAPCTSTTDCSTGVCNTGWFRGMCTTGKMGSPCNNAGECVDGLRCINDFCGTGKAGSYCRQDADCADGLSCNQKNNICGNVEQKQCQGDADCDAGQVCAKVVAKDDYSNVTATRLGAAATRVTVKACTGGAAGAPCSDDRACLNGAVCVHGRCSARGLGESCHDSCADAKNKCVCSGIWHDYCFCMTGGVGSPCDKDGDCQAANSCVKNDDGDGQRGLGTCQPKK